jgi:hypothetical protein
MAYSPSAIQKLYDTVKARMPSAQMGGIYANKPGYHNARNQLPGSDYSVQKPPDKEGDGNAASALDITWGRVEDQKLSSQRLLNAKNDSRMNCIREFFGSTNGTTVCGWDYYGGYAVTSDSSHLWHIHLSVLRKYANDAAALQKVADVITGVSSGGSTPPPSSGGTGDVPKKLQLDRVTYPLNIGANQDWELAWDKEHSDPDGMFWGTGAPNASQGQKRTYVLIGKDRETHYVSTFAMNVKNLPKDQGLWTRIVFCDMDGVNTGASPWKEHNNPSGGNMGVVDTRAYSASKGRGIKIQVRTPVQVGVDSLQWRILYWN